MMKRSSIYWKRKVLMVLLIAMVSVTGIVTGCSERKKDAEEKIQEQLESDGIYLYGETHSNEYIQKRELEIWGEYYKEGVRDLFYEMPYYDASMLNIWMKEDNDEILDRLWKAWEGTAAGEIETYNFFKSLKERYPETILHGTDIGHDYQTAGQWYLEYLEKNGRKDLEEYRKTQKNMEQGKYFYDHSENAEYRENRMVENFIEEYEALGDVPIMGIYGGAHVDIDAMAYGTSDVPCMANQLHEQYGERLHVKDLSGYDDLGEEKEPIIVEEMKVNGKKYRASYFGEFQITDDDSEYINAEYWRLEEAYSDFQSAHVVGDVWYENMFPMKLEGEQVYVVDLEKEGGRVERRYFRTDQNSFEAMGAAKEVAFD